MIRDHLDGDRSQLLRDLEREEAAMRREVARARRGESTSIVLIAPLDEVRGMSPAAHGKFIRCQSPRHRDGEACAACGRTTNEPERRGPAPGFGSVPRKARSPEWVKAREVLQAKMRSRKEARLAIIRERFEALRG